MGPSRAGVAGIHGFGIIAIRNWRMAVARLGYAGVDGVEAERTGAD
jgi:hypothetical protein